MYKVIISANYNLGLIYYVTGKYETAKLRLEKALEIKKIIIKNSYDLELFFLVIYFFYKIIINEKD